MDEGERLTVAKEIVFLVKESPKGGFEASASGYSIYTQADTMLELKRMVADAVRCHFDENDRPEIIGFRVAKE